MQAILGITNIDPILGQPSGTDDLHPVATARLVSIAADPQQLNKIGSAIALLSFIIRACGAEDTCTIKYRQVAEQCSTAEVTVRNWAGNLEKQGIIAREPVGKAGVHITLADEQIRTPRQLHADRSVLLEAQQILDAATITIGTALNAASQGIKQQLQSLSGGSTT